MSRDYTNIPRMSGKSLSIVEALLGEQKLLICSPIEHAKFIVLAKRFELTFDEKVSSTIQGYVEISNIRKLEEEKHYEEDS